MKAYSFRALGATVILTEHWLQYWKKKKERVCVLLFCFLQPGMKKWGQEMRAWERPKEGAGNTPAALSHNTHAYKYLCTLQSPDFSNKTITAVKVFT